MLRTLAPCSTRSTLALRALSLSTRSFTATAFRNEDNLIKNQFKHIQTQPTAGKDGTSASDLARRLSQAVLPKLERPNVKKVCIVGSGGLSIGQAGEFDYSGESLSGAAPRDLLEHRRGGVNERELTRYPVELLMPPAAFGRYHSHDAAERTADRQFSSSRRSSYQGDEGVQHRCVLDAWAAQRAPLTTSSSLQRRSLSTLISRPSRRPTKWPRRSTVCPSRLPAHSSTS